MIVRFRAVFPFLLVRYSDSSGRRFEKQRAWEPPFLESVPLGRLVDELNLPELAAGMPPSPNPIPIFLDIPKMFSPVPWDIALPPYLRAELVRLSRARPKRRSLFRLPLRILAVGEMARESLAWFQQSPWYRQGRVSELGIAISACALEDLPRTLRRRGADIVVTSDRRATVRACRHLPERQSPRLLINLGVEVGPRAAALPGTAELNLKLDIPPAAFLNDFLHQLVHDQPLHAAAGAARGPRPGVYTELIADPLSNHSLRLSDAFLHLRHEAERVQPFVIGVPPRLRETWQIPRPEEIAGPWDFSFARETDGLVPMSRMMAAVQSAHHSANLLRHDLRVRAPGTLEFELAGLVDLRVVTLALRRMETMPPLAMVPRDCALIAGAAYELKVNIENPSADNLVTGPQPPVAPLLPPPEAEGHELEIAVHAKDFRLLSTRVQRLILPPTAASTPVYFRIRTPVEAASAELRVCVYFRNQLVQSYVLRAQLAPFAPFYATEPQVENGVAGRLEYSRSKDEPWILDHVQPRALSIGANQAGRTHQIIFKSSQTSGELTLPEHTFEKEVQDLRAELDGLITDSSGTERIFPAVPPGAQPAPDVADAFRQLVRRGWELYQAFSAEASKAGLKKTLLAVAGDTDKKLQVVRFVDQFVFPWALLYDFKLPEERAGDPPLPICLGQVTGANNAAVTCSHTNQDEVFCVRGFWGVRHIIEEQLVQGGGKVTSLARPATGPVRVVAASNLAESANLEIDLKNLEAATENGPAAAKPLLDLLWADPAQRPAILILLAHFAEEEVLAEPLGPRVLLGGSEWLTLTQLSNRVSGSPEWDDPRPIIMQMTCHAADVKSTTVNHFLCEWNTAGAAAIIGTEARVGAATAADCALRITTGLWTGKQTLGEAVTAFRRSLVFAGNPLGFLFTAYGDVDLVVP